MRKLFSIRRIAILIERNPLLPAHHAKAESLSQRQVLSEHNWAQSCLHASKHTCITVTHATT